MSFPGADHLGDEVERNHDEGAGGGEDANLRLVEAEGGHVREGEASEIAQTLGDQEQHDRPADEEADRIDEAVEA